MGSQRVVGLGLCVLDEVLLVDDFGLAAPRTRYSERRRLPGGMMANATLQAAALGVETHLLSVLGDDDDGAFLVRALRRSGVVTRRVVRSAAHPTTLAVVLVERGTGERRFLVADRSRHERDVPELDLSPIRRGAVLMIDGHFAGQAARAAQRARERGVPVVADFADARPAFLELLPLVDHPIVPQEFVARFGHGDARETLRALSARCGGTPVVTQGARGALALHAGRFRRIPSPRVEVVDTTGAGDAFHGAFAAGLATGRDVLDALHQAARAGAASCRGLGGSSRLLTPEDL
jgi:sulfofructose kinase